MTDKLVGHVRLRRVQRRRMMANVLRRKKHSAGQRLEKNPRLNKAGDRFEPETANGFDFLAHFIELRDAVRIKRQTIDAVEIFSACILAVRRTKRLPDGLPHAMFEFRVWCSRDGGTGFISHDNL